MYSFLVPVLQLSTDVTQEAHVYLCEDGIDLWMVTLQNAPAMHTDLLQLYLNMPALLGTAKFIFPNSSSSFSSLLSFSCCCNFTIAAK